MVIEIAHQIGAKVAAEPWIILLEVFQFLLLVGIVWLVAAGTRKRPGLIKKRLATRGERVASQLEHALTADERSQDARALALETVRDARREARKIKATATRDAHKLENSARATVDAEVERIAVRVSEALDSEAAASRQELREELVEVVAQATRSVLSTSLSLSEQRDLIERAVRRATGGSSGGSSGDSASGATGDRAESPPRALIAFDEITSMPAAPGAQA
jgi:F-type H+-transporting ATPase subunit b